MQQSLQGSSLRPPYLVRMDLMSIKWSFGTSRGIMLLQCLGSSRINIAMAAVECNCKHTAQNTQ